MIKKMTKYTFVVFHTEVDKFLTELQSLGVVDITRSARAIDAESKSKIESIQHIDKLISELSLIKPNEGETIKEITIDPHKVVNEVENSLVLKHNLKDSLNNANNELHYAIPWGDYNVSDINKIKAIGFTPHFYVCTTKRYNEKWTENYPLQILNTVNDNIYFTVISENDDNYNFPLTEVRFPEKSAKEIRTEITELERQEIENRQYLLSLKAYIPDIKSSKDEIKSNLDIYLSKSGASKGAEDTITIFEGFAPTDDDSNVVAALEHYEAYYIKEEAKAEDNPPIKLKNNFFGKLYEPIGELYMLPNYGEHDLTPYFAIFYMLFFGLCLGDMGYGLVLLIGGLIVSWKLPKYSAYGKLVAWLGFGTVLMPALNGTFFGGKIYDFIPMSDTVKGMFFSDLKMFWFAIIFGLVQIIFARILKVIFTIQKNGFIAGLSEIGWILLIIWCSVAYAASEANFTYPPIFTYICGYGGLGLIVLFSATTNNIFVRVFKGVFSLYDITGVFGDMLSYIRLFGLGTAGGILGLVVNSVAMQMSSIPYMGWIFAIIMLLIGHICVLLLSCLGAFVHPMRLTFVEFYKNVGFEGGGRAYRPLKNEQNKN